MSMSIHFTDLYPVVQHCTTIKTLHKALVCTKVLAETCGEGTKFKSSYQSYDIDILIISILHMRKMKTKLIIAGRHTVSGRDRIHIHCLDPEDDLNHWSLFGEVR